MSGFSLVAWFDADDSEGAKRTFMQALDSVRHHDDDVRDVLLDTGKIMLGCTDYTEYPTKLMETERFHIYLEGKIYNKNQTSLASELVNLVDGLFCSDSVAQSHCARWLRGTDGDFVMVVVDKQSNNVLVVNDMLGRLPVYYYTAEDRVVISREFIFMATLMRSKEFDLLGIAEYLLFSYPLADRTLLKNVHRLHPATTLRIEVDSRNITTTVLRTLNFENKERMGESLSDNADALVSLFKEACVRQTRSSTRNIVALSGGVDSRTVAAGFATAGVPFEGVTYRNRQRGAKDADVAPELAKCLDIPWQLIETGVGSGELALDLLKLKGGMNFLAMSFYLHFLEQIKKQYGTGICYFTGDGGDKVLPDLSPPKRFLDVQQLARYMLDVKVMFPLADVSALTGIPEIQLVEHMEDHLTSYPEKDPSQKYVHFFIYERAVKWIFESEDRNRCYFWSASPFYSMDFFNYAMNCPDRQKANYKLYLEFLLRLCPRVCSVNDANLGVPLSSYRYRVKRRILSEIVKSPWLHKLAKKRLLPLHKKTFSLTSPLMQCLKQQVKSCSRIGEIFSSAAVQRIMNAEPPYSMIALYTLFTLTSAIELTSSGQSSLSDFFSIELD